MRIYSYLYVFNRIYTYLYTYLYVFIRIPLSYPRWGPPWGDPPPPPQPIHLWRLLFRLHSVAHAPFVVSIVRLLCCIAQANLLLTVARVLLLWHLPRFPFHDSTGFHFLLKNTMKTIHFWKIKGDSCSASFFIVFHKSL